MIENKENLEDLTLPFSISPQAEARVQVQCCQNLIINLFEKVDRSCTKEFPDVQIKRQLPNHYLKSIGNPTLQHGIYTIEVSSKTLFMTSILSN